MRGSEKPRDAIKLAPFESENLNRTPLIILAPNEGVTINVMKRFSNSNSKPRPEDSYNLEDGGEEDEVDEDEAFHASNRGKQGDMVSELKFESPAAQSINHTTRTPPSLHSSQIHVHLLLNWNAPCSRNCRNMMFLLQQNPEKKTIPASNLLTLNVFPYNENPRKKNSWCLSMASIDVLKLLDLSFGIQKSNHNLSRTQKTANSVHSIRGNRAHKEGVPNMTERTIGKVDWNIKREGSQLQHKGHLIFSAEEEEERRDARCELPTPARRTGERAEKRITVALCCLGVINNA